MQTVKIKNIEFIEIHIKGKFEPILIHRDSKPFEVLISIPHQPDATDTEPAPGDSITNSNQQQ